LVNSLSRLAGKSLVVPVTPTLVRDGALSRFASADAVWLLATDALEDAPTRKSVDRLLGAGFDFALDGFPEGAPLLPSLVGATILVDAQRVSAMQLDSRVRTLLDAGLRPLVRNVDDRAIRHRVIAAGAPLHTGRMLTRAASTPVDRLAEASVLRAVSMLAAFADGRPANAAFDEYVRDDPHLGASLLRSMRSATLGVRGPRSVEQALTLLGRDEVMEQLVGVAAFLIGEAAHDPELALIALRRARVCEQVGAALDPAPHPRARTLAGLLSVLEFALGVPPSVLLSRLNLPGVLVDALLERREPLGQLLDVVDAMEYGWWDDLRSRCSRLGIAPFIVGDAWLSAWRTAREELGFARTETT
jgi:c-di-GMP-related signal transduction protein